MVVIVMITKIKLHWQDSGRYRFGSGLTKSAKYLPTEVDRIGLRRKNDHNKFSSKNQFYVHAYLHSPNQTTSPLRSSLANVMTSHYCWHCWDSSLLNLAFESCSFDINVWRTPTTMCENINFLPTSPGSVEIRSLSSRMIFGASLTRVLASINHEKVIGPIWGLLRILH